MAMTRYVDRKKKFSVITFLDPGQTRDTVDAIRVSAQDYQLLPVSGGALTFAIPEDGLRLFIQRCLHHTSGKARSEFFY